MQPELQPIQAGTPQSSYALAQHRVLRNTYWLLAISLIPTAIGAAIGTNIDFGFMRASPMLSFFAVLAVFYGWIFAIEKNRNSALGVGLLLGFTLFLGILLGPLFQRVLGFANGVQLVMMAAGGTAATFFVMAGIATTTKRDLSALGSFLSVGVIVIMLAVVANAFFQNMTAHLVILAGFVLLSSLIMLWQVNNIVRGGETNYVSATLTLYVSIYNLFSSLLQLLGIFGGSRD
ncbi:MAG TPA: Bax inhibitor-1/YccA family protein [Burkholderiales bacterium]|jgi:modulator of FtsH protease|nr:Bax inhibitor-1/YccA family protein [Burkholderiales bacterium]